jgi:hypothetical protein
MINVIYAEELDKPNYEEVIDHIFRLTKQMGNVRNLAVDGSNPELIVSLKRKIDENSKCRIFRKRSSIAKKIISIYLNT